MSKHLGNILEPIPLMDQPRRRRPALVHAVQRLAVVVAPGRAQGARRDRVQGDPDVLVDRVVPVAVRPGQRVGAAARDGERTMLDRWALSEVHRVAAEVDDALENFDTARAGKALGGYIDDLSNWYVRRSRRRFWDGDPAALSTLHECLDVLTRLLAPFVPFVTEQVWAALFAATGSASTRCTWRRGPSADAALVDAELSEQVAPGAPAGRARPVGPGRLEDEDAPAARRRR